MLYAWALEDPSTTGLRGEVEPDLKASWVMEMFEVQVVHALHVIEPSIGESLIMTVSVCLCEVRGSIRGVTLTSSRLEG